MRRQNAKVGQLGPLLVRNHAADTSRVTTSYLSTGEVMAETSRATCPI